MELAQQMQRRGIATDVITFNATISTCQQMTQWHRVLQLFTRLLEGRVASVIAFSNAVAACDMRKQQPLQDIFANLQVLVSASLREKSWLPEPLNLA